jgi:hypothetical protein
VPVSLNWIRYIFYSYLRKLWHQAAGAHAHQRRRRVLGLQQLSQVQVPLADGDAIRSCYSYDSFFRL